jgi:hypothetical protein
VAEQALSLMASRPVGDNVARDPLTGAWRLVLTAPNGQSAQLDVTIHNAGSGYSATLRSPMGNSTTQQVTRSGNNFTIGVSEVEKKQVISIQIEGVVEGDRMNGTLTFSDGKNTATGQFSGARIS